RAAARLEAYEPRVIRLLLLRFTLAVSSLLGRTQDDEVIEARAGEHVVFCEAAQIGRHNIRIQRRSGERHGGARTGELQRIDPESVDMAACERFEARREADRSACSPGAQDFERS